ncbi:putative oxidoreductase [Paenibacillus mucilaginosus 3016]|uniref:Putative oxidoreductase n=1 Tax=Paenibacillus mucilaginosus 3016 TaxID=1116391 RepID=H6NTN9_9BACL|nr:Gfo/Idh/MocA family oxidoreductase [Paenibacillus mucilaginosus]AFC27633.1 putative oxidoreductase [Paenibacillus mucilaginosus 3016]WFA16521.1 Gfo/Idh/MocA family oxidoreductase [Paenibacillus mucilaginosus]
MRTRIGIIGLGDIARKVYLPLLSTDESVEIAGIASRSEATVERLGDQYRIAGRFGSVSELLERAQPEAVFVHSPTGTHEEIVTACLQAGVHVYVDKPLSYELQASERMAALAEERGLLLGVGFNRRFAPLYTAAKAWLEEAGGFDQAVAVKHRTKLQSLSAKETLYDDLIHMLDLLLWLDGEEAETAAYLERCNAAGQLLHCTGTLSFGRPDGRGRVGQFGMVREAGSDLERLELHGAYRSAEVVNLEQAVWMEAGSSPRHQSFGTWDTILHRRGFAGVVSHFLESLSDPQGCTIRADRVLAVHRLVEKLHP